MISIVDPDELLHVLRPTVYMPTVGMLAGRPSVGIPAENHRTPARRGSWRQDEPVTSSRHD